MHNLKKWIGWALIAISLLALGAFYTLIPGLPPIVYGAFTVLGGYLAFRPSSKRS